MGTDAVSTVDASQIYNSHVMCFGTDEDGNFGLMCNTLDGKFHDKPPVIRPAPGHEQCCGKVLIVLRKPERATEVTAQEG